MKTATKINKKKLTSFGIMLVILLWLCSGPILFWLSNFQALPSALYSNKITRAIITPPILGFILLNYYVVEPLEIKNIQYHFNKIHNIVVQKVESNDDGEIGATITRNNHSIFVGHIDVKCFTNCTSMNFSSARGTNPYFSIQSSAKDLSQKQSGCNYPPYNCDSSKVTIRTLPFKLHNYQEFFDNFDRIYDSVTQGKEGVDYQVTSKPSDYTYSF